MATLNFSPKEKEEAFDLLSSMLYQLDQLDFTTHRKADFELLKRNLMESENCSLKPCIEVIQ